MFGNIFTNPYLTGQNGTFWEINFWHLLEHLFSPTRGLFFWSPLFLIGVWGLVRQRLWVFIFSLFLLWFVGSSWSAYLAAGFGQRFSVEAAPYLAIGIAYFYAKVKYLKAILYSLPFT